MIDDLNCLTEPRWDLPTFNIALVEPEIPQNTGNIGRLCLGTGCRLQLVGELGFSIEEKSVRRAGLDYWKYVDIERHEDKHDWFDSLRASGQRFHLLSKKSEHSIWQTDFRAGDTLIFGAETRGLPEDWLRECEKNAVSIPLFDSRVRSLNLSNSVSVAVYEGLRNLSKF